MEKRNFVRKKIKSLTLGEKLRILRKDRRLRVQDLSRKINVKASYIVALENGIYDELPTKVYTKGFVKSYAQFFGVPESVLLDLFEREYGVYQNIYKKDNEEDVNRLPRIPRLIITPKMIIVFIGFLGLLIIGAYLYFSIDTFVSSPWIIVDAPVDNNVIEKNSIVVHGKTKNNSRVYINEQQVFVNDEGIFEHEVKLTQGLNVIKVRSVNKFDKEIIKEIAVNAVFDIQEKSETQEQANIKVIIKSQNEPVWIHIIADDNDVYNDILELEQEEKFTAREMMSITTSDGSNTLLSKDDGESFEQISNKRGIVRDWKIEAQNHEGDKTVELLNDGITVDKLEKAEEEK